MTEATAATLAEPQTPTDGATPAAAKASPAPAGDSGKSAAEPKPIQTGNVPDPAKATDKPATPATPAAQPAPEWKALKADGIVPSVASAYEKAAREHGMSSDAAQKMLDSLRATVSDSAKQQREDAIKSWQEHLRSDQKLGGEKFDANDAEVQKALNEFGSESLRTYLNETGLRFHPELWNLLHKVQSKVGGDKIISDGGRNATGQDEAAKFYANMNKA